MRKLFTLLLLACLMGGTAAAENISFVDANVKAICVNNWDTDGDNELSTNEAIAVNSIGTVFANNTDIKSFDELKYFTMVWQIEEHAFDGCENLVSVTLPNSVLYIEKFAFRKCYSLTSVVIPTSVQTIGTSAFNSCSSLMSVVIPEGVFSIGNVAFNNCTGLTSVVLPSTLTTIGTSVFNNCPNLTSVTVGMDTPVDISEGVFSNCANATLYVPEGATAAYQAADNWKDFKDIKDDIITFADANTKAICVAHWDTNKDGELSRAEAAAVNSLVDYFKGADTGVTSFDELQYFTRLTKIEHDAFNANATLKSVIIPSSVTNIEVRAFYYCSSLSSVTIPGSVRTIGGAAFRGCDNLQFIEIPEGVTQIYTAFATCKGLTSVTIPSTVTEIYNNAFFNCTGLTSVTLPETITTINNGAFNGCTNLTSVTVGMAKAIPIEAGVFSNRANATLYVPEGSKAAYQSADYWKEFKNIVYSPQDFILSSAGISTFSSTNDLDFSSVTGIKAYIMSGFDPRNGTLVLTPVTDVPAGTGVLIKGTPGEYSIPNTDSYMIYSNLLIGVPEATEVSPTDGDKTNFILSNGKYGINFYTMSAAGTIAAGKAYLQLPTSALAGLSKGFTLVFEDEQEATGIEGVQEFKDSRAQGYYDLQGRRVAQPVKGLYIQNGRKVLVK